MTKLWDDDRICGGVAVSNVDFEQSQDTYAMSVAGESYEWYKSHAIRSRRSYRAAEIAVLIMSGAIPLAVAIRPGTTALTAVLGASVAVISGLDSVFHWRDTTCASARHERPSKPSAAAIASRTASTSVRRRETRCWS